MFGAADDVTTSFKVQLHHALPESHAAWAQEASHAKADDETKRDHWADARSIREPRRGPDSFRRHSDLLSIHEGTGLRGSRIGTGARDVQH